MIGILTFYWADDYGGMLQAYALKRRLELLGNEAELIPYAPFKLTGRYWLCPLYAREADGGLRYYFHRYLFKRNLLQLRSFWRQRRRMRQFRQKYLTAKPPIRSAEGLFLQKYRSVFVGSDQVWNPDITVGLDDAYIGNIPNRENCRLASYGASLGGNRLSEDGQQRFVRHVGGFSAVSLRERTDAAYVGRLLGRKVCDVLDPVLLLERPEWERVEKLPQESGYILIYLTQYNEPLLRCAETLSAQLGRKIVSLSRHTSQEKGRIPGLETWGGGGPAEFLGYLKNAACVLTNSFHGTAFSILLEKPFLTFRHDTRSARMEDLLEKLGLRSHLAETDLSDKAMEIWEGTDWEAVRARLAAEREKSNRFLMENI